VANWVGWAITVNRHAAGEGIMMKTIFLFGAGASWGSEAHNVSRPPLGRDLFVELEKRGGYASTLSTDLKDLFKKDFEEGMAEFFIRYNKNTSHFQRELAQYLCLFIPSTSSCYQAIVAIYAGRDVSFVSLNYDLLLERAALNLGARVNYSGNPLPGSVSVLKIHGSANLWPDFGNHVFHVGDMSDAVADIVGKYKFVNPAAVHLEFQNSSGIAPAMALYAKGKAVRVCPEAVLYQQDMWVQKLSNADVLNVIGVLIQVEDSHIWGEIARFKGKINYFGGDSDKTLFDAWVANLPDLNIEFHLMYFKDATKYLFGEILSGRA
jgi:hypothetical protein